MALGLGASVLLVRLEPLGSALWISASRKAERAEGPLFCTGTWDFDLILNQLRGESPLRGEVDGFADSSQHPRPSARFEDWVLEARQAQRPQRVGRAPRLTIR